MAAASTTGMLVGTIHYMAPEQLEGKPVDPRTDIYALGAVIYDVTHGALTRLAFEGSINDSPVWSPDGSRIAIRSDRAGVNRVFWQRADGSGGAEQLTDGNVGELPRSFSPDGQMLA
jgi:Tol biopolymer transport system component